MNMNATLIGQSITFFIFVWFCMKYIWPPIKAAMKERQEAIAEGLASAEKATADLADAEEHAAAELQRARDEAQQILEQARQRASAMVEEAKTTARDEGERLKESAQADIEQEVNRAREVLRGQVSALAVAGAERVLGESIDAGAHSALLDKLAAEL